MWKMGNQRKRIYLHPRVWLFCAAAYTVGILLGARTVPAIGLCLLAAAGCLLLAMILRDKGRWVSLAMAAAICLGLWAGSSAYTPRYPELPQESTVSIRGYVSKVRAGEESSTYLLEKVSINGQHISEKIYLHTASQYVCGDEIMAEVTLRVPSGPLHPGDFDDYRYCRSQKVMYRAFSRADAKTGTLNGPMAWIYRWNRSLAAKIERLYPMHADLAKAFVLGDEGDVEQLRKDQLQLTGLTHILSISGSHIGILAGLVQLLFRNRTVDRRIPFWVGQAVIVGYTLLTGCKISMVRATYMYEVLVWTKYFGKRYDPLNGLAFSYLLCIAGNAMAVFDLGLQLSFSATLGMMLLTKPLEKYTQWLRPKALRQALCTGIGAAVASFPVTNNLNHYYWLPGLLANMLAVLYSVLMIPLLLGVTVGGILLGGKNFLGQIGAACIHVFDTFVGWCSQHSELGIWLPALSGAVILVWYLSLYVYSDKVFLCKKAKACIAAGVSILVLATMMLPKANGKRITLQCFAEEALCTVISTPSGERVLLTDGSGEAALEYTLTEGGSFSACILTDVGSGTEAVLQLHAMGRIRTVYGTRQVVEVLRYKYGTAAVLLPEHLQIDRKTELSQCAGGNGLLLSEDGEGVCLFVLEFHEILQREIGSIPVLYYNKGMHSTLQDNIQWRRFIYAEDGESAAVGENLYETGMLTIALGSAGEK